MHDEYIDITCPNCRKINVFPLGIDLKGKLYCDRCGTILTRKIEKKDKREDYHRG